MITTTCSRSGSQFLTDFFGLVEESDFVDVSDEQDTENMISRYSIHNGKVTVRYSTARVEYGEMSYRLNFRALDGSQAACSGGTISPRYSAGGNGTYLQGIPGIHWDEEEVEECRAFLASLMEARPEAKI